MITVQERLREAAEEFNRGSTMDVLLVFAADRIDYLERQLARMEQVVDTVARRHCVITEERDVVLRKLGEFAIELKRRLEE